MITSAAPIQKTQADLCLDELRRRHGQWVPMPELASACGGYAVHSRIADLRRRGLLIDCKQEVRPGSRLRLSYYRLTSPIQEGLPL